jgi:hypothetical protein
MLEQKPRQSSFSLFRGIFCLRDHQPDRPPRESVRLGSRHGDHQGRRRVDAPRRSGQ